MDASNPRSASHLLSDRPAAIDGQDCSRNEAVRLVGQEQNRARDLLRFGPAAQRVNIADLLRKLMLWGIGYKMIGMRSCLEVILVFYADLA